jgi:hypothetical protein
MLPIVVNGAVELIILPKALLGMSCIVFIIEVDGGLTTTMGVVCGGKEITTDRRLHNFFPHDDSLFKHFPQYGSPVKHSPTISCGHALHTPQPPCHSTFSPMAHMSLHWLHTPLLFQ